MVPGVLEPIVYIFIHIHTISGKGKEKLAVRQSTRGQRLIRLGFRRVKIYHTIVMR